MKQTAFGMVCMMLITLLLMIVMTIYGRNLRQSETNHTLAEAVDTTMSNLMENQAYSIESKDAFIADLLQSLLVQINSTSDVTVAILEADEKKGILSVEVTENYKHPNGKMGSVSAVRTVIFDRTIEEEKEQVAVEFYIADEELYKKYLLEKGSMCVLPAPPKKEGKTFKNWRFVTGGQGVAEEIKVPTGIGAEDRTVIASRGKPHILSGNVKLIAVFE